MTRPRIETTFVETCTGHSFWEAHDDTQGADTSPVGRGATQQEAIDDLMAQLEGTE